MPLTDTRRQQLDGVVQKMIANKESDSNVQLVVNDFVNKYKSESVSSELENTTQNNNDRSFLGNVATGVAKGELKTLQGLGKLGPTVANQTAGRVVNAVQGEGFKPTTEKYAFDNSEIDAKLKPKGAGENIGFYGEKISEFFLPASAVNKSAKLANASINATNLPTYAKFGAKVLAGAGIEGVGAGLVTTAQSGSFKEGGKSALISALISAPFKAFSVAKEPLGKVLQTSAQKSGAQALGATTKQNKQLSDKIVPELLKRKVVFGTRSGTLTKASSQADDIGSKINEAFDKLPDDAKVAVAPIIKNLEDAKSVFMVKGTNMIPAAALGKYKALQEIQREILSLTGDEFTRNSDTIASTLTNHLKSAQMILDNNPNVPINELLKRTQINIADQLKHKGDDALAEVVRNVDTLNFNNLKDYATAVNDAIRGEVGTISVNSVRSFRQILDKVISQSKGGFGLTGDETAKLLAQKEGANAIRETLAQEFPDIALLNKEFNFWKNVEKVVGDTVQRTKGQGTPLGEVAAEASGAVVGGMRGGTTGGILLTATGLRLIQKLVTSPAWRQTSGVMKNELAKAIMSGSTELVSQTINRIINAGVSQSMQNR